MTLNDEERQAASMVSAISSNVGTAALGALAGLIALYTYLGQTYNLGAGFYVVVGGAALCLAASIVFGGLGTKALVGKVAGGSWELNDEILPYRVQTWSAGVGLALIVLATVIAVNSPKAGDRTARDLLKLSERVAALEHRKSAQQSGVTVIRTCWEKHGTRCRYTRRHWMRQGLDDAARRSSEGDKSR